MDLFRRWLSDAKESSELPEAMALATSTPNGRPSNRFVLLKGADDRGFIFFSNYESRKGQELDANPRAAAAIFWSVPRRQVRVEGRVERLSSIESDDYFSTRDRLSQLGAAVSPQSREISDRASIDRAVEELEGETTGRAIERPSHWGGYRIIPDVIEFWVGREGRVHDRFAYRRTDQGWSLSHLAP